ncbi:MAG: hypothetical protein Kow0042_29610 [Calditrichia bacterium]
MFDAAPKTELKKILVVDDEPNFHKLIQIQFSRWNFEIISCLESEEVIEKIEQTRPDLVLMDLMMPKLDGISATRRIRNLGLDSYLPIIVVTARKEVSEVVAALEAGADDYITKPFEFEELHARIRNMLRMKHLQDSLLQNTKELDEANRQIMRLNQVLTNTNRQLQKKVYDLHNIFEISFKVMGQTDPVRLVNTALLNALGIFTAKSVLLLRLSSEDHHEFEVMESKGFLSSKIENLTIPRHDKLVHYLELIKKPFQIKDVVREFKDIIPMLNNLEICVVAPLFQKEEIVGILCLGPSVTDTEYPPDAMELLGIVTNMLSVALNNAQNFEKIKALSYTDGMTGLHNYRFFKLRLKEEIARSRRNKLPLSLLILDVDFFKNYNDTLGHPAGDEVLRRLSSILMKMVRDNDIVARYGGEEFAIILPVTDRNGALALGERIRAKVEEYKFPQEEIQPRGTLTISIGISTYPEDAIVLEDLIVTADRALYYAKEAGRNKVVLYNEIQD